VCPIRNIMPPAERWKDDEVFGAQSHGGEAFGAERGSVARRIGVWLLTRGRLAMLLLCLGIVTAVLVTSTSENVAFEEVVAAFSNGQTGHGGVATPTECVHEQPPELATVGVARVLVLRAAVQSAAGEADGQVHARGTVVPDDAWSDNEPASEASPASETAERSSSEGKGWPGGYEIRQWAPDPWWGSRYSDDVVVDAFAFVNAEQADRFFAEATSARCRALGSTAPARRPFGARALVRVNPDGATEEDVYVRRGRIVYRVADVRPQDHDPGPSTAEDRAGVLTAEALACGLPDTGCPSRSSRPAPRAPRG
jgi:hypothetical protein